MSILKSLVIRTGCFVAAAALVIPISIGASDSGLPLQSASAVVQQTAAESFWTQGPEAFWGPCYIPFLCGRPKRSAW